MFAYIFIFFLAAADNNNPFIKYVLPKSELDIAHKDGECKTFPANFEVSLIEIVLLKIIVSKLRY